MHAMMMMILTRRSMRCLREMTMLVSLYKILLPWLVAASQIKFKTFHMQNAQCTIKKEEKICWNSSLENFYIVKSFCVIMDVMRELHFVYFVCLRALNCTVKFLCNFLKKIPRNYFIKIMKSCTILIKKYYKICFQVLHHFWCIKFQK